MSNPTIDTTARVEDIRWMVETGECATGAAARLGMTREALAKWAARHMPEEWRRLNARDPRDPNLYAGRIEAACVRWSRERVAS